MRIQRFLLTTAVGFALLADPGSLAADAVVPTKPINEEARVRARAVPVRLEPQKSASPGVCLELGIDDLQVRVRGETLNRERLLALERERPANVHALLLDTSGSIVGSLDRAREAAAEYVQQLGEHDHATVLTFDDSLVMAQAPTRDVGHLTGAISAVRMADAATSLNDGLYYTIRELDTRPERPVIILLTDGMDTTSLHERYQIRRMIDQRPELAIFTIGVELPPMFAGLQVPAGVNTLRSYLADLAGRSNGRFFDLPGSRGLPRVYRQIREMLEQEATLVFLDDADDPTPPRLKVRSVIDGCRVRVLRIREETVNDPTLLPIEPSRTRVPLELALPPGEAYRKLHDRAPGQGLAPGCRPAAGSDATWSWFVQAFEGRVMGCSLDVVMDAGQLHNYWEMRGTLRNDWLQMKTRHFEFSLQDTEALPSAPEQLLDRLASAVLSVRDTMPEVDFRHKPISDHARPSSDVPLLIHGQSFLEIRPRLARALYAYPAYRTQADRKLQEQAQRELGRLAERFREAAPDADTETLQLAVRESKRGQQILRRSRRPSEADLAGELAAWLGDVSAHDLMVGWERLQIARTLRRDDASDTAFLEGWQALRRVFFAPSYSRVLTLISPVYDTDTDRIGFWRIVLPRPGWLFPRLRAHKGHPEYEDLPMDLIPDTPMAYGLMQHLSQEHPELFEHLRRQSYQVAEIDYRLTGERHRQTPYKAFRQVEIRVTFEAPGQRSFALAAELTRKRKAARHRVEWLELTAQGDPVLDALADDVRRRENDTTARLETIAVLR